MNVSGAASAMIAQASPVSVGASAPPPQQADAGAARGADTVSLSPAAQAKLHGAKACGSCG
jgi:hypothetical protein